MKKNGFAVVALLILMPLFASVLALMAATYLVLRTDAKSRHVCRTELLHSQMKVVSLLEELIALNTEAQALRREREQAEEMVKMTEAVGESAILFRARLAYVIAKQVAFAAKQKAIVMQARTESTLAPSRLLPKLHVGIAEDARVYHGSSSTMQAHVAKVGRFAVETQPKDSLTPDYQPAFDFPAQQEAVLRWSYSPLSLLPNWITRFLTSRSPSLRAECAATIIKTKGDAQWSAVLSAAKR